MKCPVCRATYRGREDRKQEVLGTSQESGVGSQESEETVSGNSLQSSPRPSLVCRRCGVDLAPLIQLYDQAIWYHRQAIQSFQAGDYATAIAHNQQAIALHSQQPDFHALAGQLAALQGDFSQAITAWETAQRLDPKHPTATFFLKLVDLPQSSPDPDDAKR